jgi:hypothetical protein
MKPFPKALSLVLLGIAAALPALAHDTWLLPERASVPPGTEVALDLTSGMAFPALDSAIQADRVGRALCRLAGKTTPIVTKKTGAHSLELRTKLAAPGVATLAVVLTPKPIDLQPAEVAEYLDEIGASAAIRQAWTGMKEPKRWHEVYTKHSKTFVRVGDPAGDRSWSEPLGLGLEIVPEKDPTVLAAGDEVPVRVLRKGKPVPGFTVGLVHEGEAKGLLKITDARGRVVFRLDQSGRWLLRGTDLRQASGNGSWESDFTTLVLVAR